MRIVTYRPEARGPGEFSKVYLVHQKYINKVEEVEVNMKYKCEDSRRSDRGDRRSFNELLCS